MTLKRHLFNKQALRAVLPLVGLGVVAAAISGCGGASTNNNPIVATPDSGPVIYGQSALAIINGSTIQGETSGLTFTPDSGKAEAALVAATGYKTVAGSGPLPSYQASFPPIGIPTGFSPGGAYYNNATSIVNAAVPTTYAGNLVFGAYISTGVRSGLPVDLNTGSVVLTSSESSTFSEQLAFDPTFGSGVLAQSQYKTAAFPLPAFMQTTGLHNLHASVSDVDGQSSATDFSVVSLAPADSAALVTVNFTNSSKQTAPVAGAVATITGALPSVAAYKDSAAPTGADALPITTSYADAQGSVLLFAAPGPQTVTVTGIDPFDGKTAVSGTVQITLVAGQANTTGVVATTITPAATATAAAIARVKLMQRHLTKN